MSATSVTADPAAPVRSSLLSWLAVVSVMMGIFAIVTTEILPIGVLTSVAASFGVSDGVAGLTMTMPGVLAAIAAPTLTIATARLDRRLMLCLSMLVLTVANVLAAVATAYWLMLISRVLVGLVIGAFWSIGAGLGARLVRPARAGLATAVIFSAVPLGSVLGVPAGTLIGSIADWRAAFMTLAVVSACVCVSLMVFLPSLPPGEVTRVSVLCAMLRTTAVRIGMACTFLIVLAHFGTYTYVTPFLETVTGIAPGGITVCLLIYGAAGILGNFVAGALVQRNLRVTFGGSASLLAGATLLLPVFGTSELGVVVLLMVWGIAYGAVPVCSQSWFTASAPHAPEAATVVFTASFQATIAMGAFAGGVVVDATSPSVVMALGGMVALLMVATLCVAKVDGPVQSP